MPQSRIEYLESVHLIETRVQQVLDAIDKKMSDNPGKDKILVRTEALANIHLLLEVQSRLVKGLLEQNETIFDQFESLSARLSA